MQIIMLKSNHNLYFIIIINVSNNNNVLLKINIKKEKLKTYLLIIL